MNDLFNTKIRDNRGKDFSNIDTSVSRGMGRYGANVGSSGSTGPRVVSEIPIFMTWNGFPLLWNGSLMYWR